MKGRWGYAKLVRQVEVMPRFLWVALLLLAAGGCVRDAAHATAALPPGLVVLGHSSSIGVFLEDLARIEGTPIAAFAEGARTQVAACAGRAALVLPSSSRADDPAHRWLCGNDAMPGAFAELGADEFVVVAPGVGRRSFARIRVGRQSGAHEVWLDVAPAEPTLLALFAPHDVEPRIDRLPKAGSIFHAHLASEGGLPIPADSSAEIRTGAQALFDGSWEAALLSPGAGDTTPAPVVALGLRSVELGARALATVTELAARPFGGRTRAVPMAGGADATCLAERAIVLGFAPCAAVHRGALIAGWNQRALERVLAMDVMTTSRGIMIDFDVMAAADSFLANGASEAPMPAARMPWRRLSLEARARGVLSGVLEVRQ